MQRRPSILVVGSINMDLVLKTGILPAGGETVFGDGYSYIPGGKGANQGVAAARLGADVTFAGRIGKDSTGYQLKRNLENEGIDTRFVMEDPSSGTGLAAIMVEKSGQNRIIVFSGANMKVDCEDVERAFEYHYDAAIVQFEVPEDVVIKTCLMGSEKNIPVILDAGPARQFPLERLGGLEILSPNESETYALTGIKLGSVEDMQKASEILRQRSNAKIIVLKLGEQGAYLYFDGKGELFSSYKVKAVDTTAAGDAFTAALAVKYIMRRDIYEAVKFANVTGAITVTRIGAQPSLPTIDEVRKFKVE